MENNTALTVQNDQQLPARVIQPVITVSELKAQVTDLDNFYRALMQEGTDYGKIPGTDKPTLLKSGAELLRYRSNLNPKFEVDDKGTDWKIGLFNYIITCNLYKDGEFIGAGVGSCNSYETKYRFRWVFESQLPRLTDKAGLPTKTINTKRGRAVMYRIDNENPQDLANTILKMAKKRAFVDAILTVTGASRIFTQDVEDFQEEMPNDPALAQKTEPNPPAASAPVVVPNPPPDALAADMNGNGHSDDLFPPEPGSPELPKAEKTLLQGQKPRATPANIRVIEAHRKRLGDEKFWNTAHELNIQTTANLYDDQAAALIGALSKVK